MDTYVFIQSTVRPLCVHCASTVVFIQSTVHPQRKTSSFRRSRGARRLTASQVRRTSRRRACWRAVEFRRANSRLCSYVTCRMSILRLCSYVICRMSILRLLSSVRLFGRARALEHAQASKRALAYAGARQLARVRASARAQAVSFSR